MTPLEAFGEVRRIVDKSNSLHVHEVIKLVEEKFKSTNKQMPPCPYHRHLFAQYGYDHFCDHPDKCEW